MNTLPYIPKAFVTHMHLAYIPLETIAAAKWIYYMYNLFLWTKDVWGYIGNVKIGIANHITFTVKMHFICYD